jgi:hypothetical protein
VGYYAALSGSSVPTFRDNLPVPSSRVKEVQEENMEPIRCPETSVQNNHLTLCNIPEDRRCQHRAGSLKSRSLDFSLFSNSDVMIPRYDAIYGYDESISISNIFPGLTVLSISTGIP